MDEQEEEINIVESLRQQLTRKDYQVLGILVMMAMMVVMTTILVVVMMVKKMSDSCHGDACDFPADRDKTGSSKLCSPFAQV